MVDTGERGCFIRRTRMPYFIFARVKPKQGGAAST